MGKAGRDIFPRTYQIERRDFRGVEPICEADNFNVAKAAFDASLQEYTMAEIVLKNGARVIQTAKTGLYDHETRSVALLSRSE